jgi:hypothetical protein
MSDLFVTVMYPTIKGESISRLSEGSNNLSKPVTSKQGILKLCLEFSLDGQKMVAPMNFLDSDSLSLLLCFGMTGIVEEHFTYAPTKNVHHENDSKAEFHRQATVNICNMEMSLCDFHSCCLSHGQFFNAATSASLASSHSTTNFLVASVSTTSVANANTFFHPPSDPDEHTSGRHLLKPTSVLITSQLLSKDKFDMDQDVSETMSLSFEKKISGAFSYQDVTFLVKMASIMETLSFDISKSLVVQQRENQSTTESATIGLFFFEDLGNFTLGPQKCLSLKLKFPSAKILLMDDVYGHTIPIMSVEVSKFGSNIKCYTQSPWDMEMNLTFDVSATYLNLVSMSWEPFLSSWACSITILFNDMLASHGDQDICAHFVWPPQGMTFLLKSHDPVSLYVSESFGHVIASFSRGLNWIAKAGVIDDASCGLCCDRVISSCTMMWVINETGLTIKCSGNFFEETHVHPGTGEPLIFQDVFLTTVSPGHVPQTLTIFVEKRLTSNYLPWWRQVNIDLECTGAPLFPNAYYDYNDFNGSIFRPPSLW